MDAHALLRRSELALDLEGCNLVDEWHSRTAQFIRFRLDSQNLDAVTRHETHLPREKLQNLFCLSQQVSRSLIEVDGPTRCPAALAIDVEAKLIISEFAHGTSMSRQLQDAIEQRDVATANGLATRAGRALAAFHSTATGPHDRFSRGVSRNGHAKNPGRLSEWPTVFLFGDFAPYNILVDGETLHLLDLPNERRTGPASHDLATFIFHLRRTIARTAARDTQRDAAIRSAIHQFLTGYRDELGGLPHSNGQVARVEAARAFRMARKRVTMRRYLSATTYLRWALVRALGGHPRVGTHRL